MSELKGQLLGIILVIAVFGVVMGLLSAAFQSSAEAISDRVEDIAYTGTSAPQQQPAAHPNFAYHF